jgi:hypothetical protein
MHLSIVWFCLLLLGAIACLAIGAWLGGTHRVARRAAIAVASIGLVVAALPRFYPTLLHDVLPLGMSIWLEGVLATFPWMFLTGILWGGPRSPRLGRIGPLMAALGVVYFAFGGIWMVLPDVRPLDREVRTMRDVTLQSRPDTCVPAACATALRRLGVPATEAEMCSVVMARPGRGSTLGRAAHGLRGYLERHGIDVSLEDLDADEVIWTARPDRPVLVVIRSNLAADHMVAVIGGYGYAVGIANPSPGAHGGVMSGQNPDFPGVELLTREQFRRLYRGGAIVFDARDGRSGPVAGEPPVMPAQKRIEPEKNRPSSPASNS